jgi:hypothetical protein
VDIKELAGMVQEVLNAQQTFFKGRRPEDLQHSKALEKKLAEVVKEILNPQSKLL